MNKLIVLLLLLLFNCKSYSQENTNSKSLNNDLYIYINDLAFAGSKGYYIARFTVPSIDKRFSHDNYSFRIYDPMMEERKLFALGKLTDSVNFIIPKEYYKDKPAHLTHNELSLSRKKPKFQIFVVTETPKSILNPKSDGYKKYIVWKAYYDGTVKDFSYTNLSRSVFLREK